MKSYSIQQKPCQFIAEGCSYQLQRYKNNLKKRMFLSENIEIAENISRVSRLHQVEEWRKVIAKVHKKQIKSGKTLLS